MTLLIIIHDIVSIIIQINLPAKVNISLPTIVERALVYI